MDTWPAVDRGLPTVSRRMMNRPRVAVDWNARGRDGLVRVGAEDVHPYGVGSRVLAFDPTDETSASAVVVHIDADRGLAFLARSEERRVGKECRSRWSPYH